MDAPPTWPKDASQSADFIPLLGGQFYSWPGTPKAPSLPPDYNLLEDRKPLWLCFAGPQHETLTSAFTASNTLSVYGNPPADAMANIPFNGALNDLCTTPDDHFVQLIMGTPSRSRHRFRLPPGGPHLPCPDPQQPWLADLTPSSWPSRATSQS